MEPGRYQSKKEKNKLQNNNTGWSKCHKTEKEQEKNKVMAMPACGENGNQLPIPGMSVLNIT